MSLYKKYRPQTFEQVRGNEEMVESISKAIEDPDKCNHSFLLHGETGCGKTTIARIIANVLEISETDLQEINCSDYRGIDDARAIIKNAQYKPMESTYRMFLLDEVHQLTTQAQDSLLKILEDVPPHVFFVLCTTEAQKLKKTIRGRCLQFQINLLTERQMKGLLKSICKKEKEKLPEEVLLQIIKSSQGHPRDAINILEQVLNVEEEQRLETAKKVEQVQSLAIDLARLLIKNSSWSEVKLVLEGLKGEDAESIRRVVLGYAQAVLLKSDNAKAGLVLEEFLEPTYNSGFPQIVFASYLITKNN